MGMAPFKQAPMERLLLARFRSRFAILTVLLAYLAGAAIGVTMALAGSHFALGYRDHIVDVGLTDKIRSIVLASNSAPLSAIQIRSELQRVGSYGAFGPCLAFEAFITR